MAIDMALAVGMKLGKYELKKQLGQGGFGVVFLGYDVDLEREVALKFMHAEHTANPDILRRFLQEARSAAKIAHPGIVTVFECSQIQHTGTDVDGMAYIAMELLHGEPLSDRLQRQRRLSPTAAMEIGRQVALALEAAHRAGIIHRDLKPDNIFLVTDPAMPGGERVKVLDFGIAKLAQQPPSGGVQTHSAMVFGTPRYMSPEQCRSSASIDHRSDIYTLGCILFELVTGSAPFEGEMGELIAKHQMVAPPTARSLNPAVPPHLDELIAKTLAKQPGERPQTMAALAQALDGKRDAALAPTLPPDAGESLPKFTPAPGSLQPPSAEALQAARPVATTLGTANASRAVTPPTKSRATLAIAAVAGIALLGGGVFVATRGSSETIEPAGPGSAPPPKPVIREVSIELSSTPTAEVYLMPDSRLVGETPYRAKRPPAEGSLVFVLKATGFEERRVVVPADKDVTQSVELVALPKPAGSGSAVAVKPPKGPFDPPKPPPTGTKPRDPPKPPKPGSNSGHIDVYPDN